MNECNIVRDLLPLYAEELACEDSTRFVCEHLRRCPDCAAELEKLRRPGEIFPEEKGGKEQESRQTELRHFKSLRRRLSLGIQTFCAVLMLLGLVFGLGLTNSGNLFFNTLIMPLVGILGYAVFRWRGSWTLPVLFVGTLCVLNLVNRLRGAEYLGPGEMILWSMIYGAFLLAGMLIAWLIHFSFKKESD